MRIIIEFDTNDPQGSTPVIKREGDSQLSGTKPSATGAIDAGASNVGSAQQTSNFPEMPQETGAPLISQPGMLTAGSAPEL